MRGLLFASLLMFGSMTEAKTLDSERSEVILAKGTVLDVKAEDSRTYRALVSYEAQIYICHVVDLRNPSHLWIYCIDSEE